MLGMFFDKGLAMMYVLKIGIVVLYTDEEERMTENGGSYIHIFLYNFPLRPTSSLVACVQ